MIVIKNSNDQIFCHPGTSDPFVFQSTEQAEYIIDSMGLGGAFAVEVDNPEEKEERYGGENDLW